MEVLTVNEAEFIVQSLRERSIRIDGRGPFDYRNFGIKFHEKRGQVEVALGNSLVLASVYSTIVSPSASRPHEGFLDFNVDFLPCAHPNFEQVLGNRIDPLRRSRNEVATEIERLLEKVVKKAKAINVESLCIKSREFVWKVLVKVLIISHAGNMQDLCTVASTLALMHFRVPEVKVDDQKQLVTLAVWKGLSLHFLPVSITLGFLDEGELVVIDPLAAEEHITEGRLTICMNVYGDILNLSMSGGACISEAVLMQAIEVAKLKATDITHMMRMAVESDIALARERGLLSQI